MEDITVLYYTSNRIEEPFATNVRNHLLSFISKGTPIISISQKPMNFGNNIYVKDLNPSIYNIYKQIYIGASAVSTRYIMCAEDDALYNLEHFQYRPPDDAFGYNLNKWMVNGNFFFHRNRVNMSTCVAPTDLMVNTLEVRLTKYPDPEMKLVKWGEPGRFEEFLGLPIVKMDLFKTEQAVLTFNHRPSVGGVRRTMKGDVIKEELMGWSKATELWKEMYEGGGKNGNSNRTF